MLTSLKTSYCLTGAHSDFSHSNRNMSRAGLVIKLLLSLIKILIAVQMIKYFSGLTVRAQKNLNERRDIANKEMLFFK